MADERIQGKRYTLYVTTTDPSTATGTSPEQNKTNYTIVGKVANLSPTSSWSTIEATDRDAGSVVDALTDALTVGLDVSVNIQRDDGTGTIAEDAGHDILTDAHGTSAQDVVYWLILPEDPQGTTIIGLRGFYSKGRVESWNPGFDTGSTAQYEYTLGSAGAEITPFVTT